MKFENNNNSLYIFEKHQIDPDKYVSNSCLWNGYKDFENCISIPNYLEKNAKKFRNKYITFIHELGLKKISNKHLFQHLEIKKNHNLWWMSLLFEKSHYKSPRIKDCLKLFALEEIILEKKPNQVTFVSSDKYLSQTIEDLCRKLNIKFKFEKNSSKKNEDNLNFEYRKLYFKLPYLFQSIIYLFKNILIHWPLRKVRIKWFFGNNSISLFSYLFHVDKEKFDEGKYQTGQWGPIINLLKELKIKSNWVHHFIPSKTIPNSKDGIKFIKKLNHDIEQNTLHQFLYGELSPKIIFYVLIVYIKFILIFPFLVRFKKCFKSESSYINFWYLLKHDFLNSIIGPKLIENLIWIELFDSTLSKASHQKKGIFLYENQSWEKALISSWKKYNHGELLALNNGFVRFWDTRFFENYNKINIAESKKHPMADVTILTDKLSWKEYIDSGYPEKKLAKAETVRYFDLLSKKDEIKENNSYKKIIALGDIVFKTTNNMMKLLEKTHNKKKFKWQFKPHPACEIDLKNYKKIDFELCEKEIKDIISNFDIAIAPAATLSVLEPYIKNLSVIIFLDEDEINLSPLRKFNDVITVHNSDEMNEALIKIKPNLKKQNESIFWFEKDLSLWKKILS